MTLFRRILRWLRGETLLPPLPPALDVNRPQNVYRSPAPEPPVSKRPRPGPGASRLGKPAPTVPTLPRNIVGKPPIPPAVGPGRKVLMRRRPPDPPAPVIGHG